MKNRLLYIASCVILALAIGFLMYFYYLQFYPFEIVRLHTFESQQQQVVAGEPIKIKIKFEKFMDYEATIKWSLIDGFVYGIPRESVFRGTGENEVYTYFIIPSTTPSGEYQLQAQLSYKISPFRTIHYVWKTNRFEVINSQKP